MRKFILLILLTFSFGAVATEQIKEEFLVNGVSHRIDSTPLETLFTYEDIHLMLDTRGWCSANWRGYKGTWELKDGELLLNSLVKGACNKNPPLVDPVLFFGEQEYPVKVKWFNGEIVIRLSENSFTNCRSPDGKVITTGYTYEVMVYEFSAGDFVYKSKQTIKQEWQHSLASCSTGVN